MYPLNISAFVDDNNHQTVNNVLSILFNTQSQVLRHDDKIRTFRNVLLASLMQYNKDFKGIEERQT